MAEEQVEIQEEVPAGPPPKKKKGMLKILTLVFVVLLLGGGAAYYFYGKTFMAHYAERQKQETEHKEKGEVGPVMALEPFVINVSGNSSKYVKISVALEAKDGKVLEHAKKVNPIIRDALLTVLCAKAPEVFMDVNARSSIKKELLDVVKPLFKNGEVKAVYITDIIMQ